ncbi:hypothetical protein HW115_16035 [Verrucomicrobiaceae bacterium N1E253]|uniref:Uncharacterized protein n=1 Tax=Oceaniferula marina TaxID=2748318 RepID=A0A851GJF3_9BACT|nr:hypothetical protein [Oceaniferula marina]NWK57132.1 hypothetical protein [Oceaniferula marina]
MEVTLTTFSKLCLLAGISSLFCSCGGVKYYQHDRTLVKMGKPLPPLRLLVGERIPVVKHTTGVTSIGGGYFTGLFVETPGLVEIKYGPDGRGDRFAPLLSIEGLRPGVTQASYGNRLGEVPDFSSPGSTSNVLGQSFTIEVE